MALTIREVDVSPVGNILELLSKQNEKYKFIVLDVDFDSSYLAGGELFDLSPYVGAGGNIIYVDAPEDTKGSNIEYSPGANRDPALGKLKVYVATGAAGSNAEVSGGSDVSSLSNIRIVALAN